MKVIREQIAFAMTVGMFVLGLWFLAEQTRMYQWAYQYLNSIMGHSSVTVEIEE